MRLIVEAHIPHGSGDAEWRLVDADSGVVVAIVDPNMAIDDPASVAATIADRFNTLGE